VSNENEKTKNMLNNHILLVIACFGSTCYDLSLLFHTVSHSEHRYTYFIFVSSYLRYKISLFVSLVVFVLHSAFGHNILFTLGKVGSSLVYLLIIWLNDCSPCLICVFETHTFSYARSLSSLPQFLQ